MEEGSAETYGRRSARSKIVRRACSVFEQVVLFVSSQDAEGRFCC